MLFTYSHKNSVHPPNTTKNNALPNTNIVRPVFDGIRNFNYLLLSSKSGCSSCGGR